jgi:hypothetical protein
LRQEDVFYEALVSPSPRKRSMMLGSLPRRAINNSILYVWGIVRYDDGFTKGRFTRYCHRYNFSGLTKGTYSFSPERYRYHHHGNEIDDKD